MLRARHSSVVMRPMPTVRSRQIGFSESSSSYSAAPCSTVSHSSSDPLLPTVGKVGGDATGTDEVVVHPQAGDVLEVAQHLFALAPAVEHHRHRADVHAVRRLEQQVRRHAVELDEHHADPRRAWRHVDVEQPLDRHAVDELVRERRRVVHARDVGAALHVRELLAGLLHAGVEVTDHRLDAQHFFGVELHHEPQHAVRRRVLRTHVDDHRVVERDLPATCRRR